MAMVPTHEAFPAVPDAIRRWAATRNLVVEFHERGADEEILRCTASFHAPAEDGSAGPFLFALLGIDPAHDDAAETIAQLDRGVAGLNLAARRALASRHTTGTP